MACITFNLIRGFIQNVVRTNKKVLNRVVYVNLKRKTIRYSALFMFLIKTWKFKENTEKLIFGGKNILFFLKENGFVIKNIVKCR